jgi:LTXXQ motif family protein
MPLLQKLGGALGAASGYLAKSCPKDIPAQPIARLQLMQSQIEELEMAIDVARQPLQDFEQSLSADQKTRFETATPPPDADRRIRTSAAVPTCGGLPAAIDWSIDQIDKSVQPTDAQRDDLASIKQSFSKAATDLETHCPTVAPPTALGRLESIQARLDATWRAALSIQVALADFETKLSDEQKGRFDNMNLAAQ